MEVKKKIHHTIHIELRVDEAEKLKYLLKKYCDYYDDSDDDDDFSSEFAVVWILKFFEEKTKGK